MREDHYKLLGIKRGSSDKEIKKAFRTLALKYHPDKNEGTGAEAKFKEISEAYNVLSDPEKKAAYDHYGHEGVRSASYQSVNTEDLFASFGDFFGDIFGAGTRASRSRATRGKDIKHAIKIDLNQTLFDSKATIKIKRSLNCHACRGSGCARGKSPEECRPCNGTGFNTISQGHMNLKTTCRICSGSGESIVDRCKNCNGTRLEIHEESLRVTIPKGVESGTTIRVSGKGDLCGGAYSPGDLYLTILINKHKNFDRNGNNILYKLKIDYTIACLGGPIIVPTLHGECRINIPSGTQNGDTLRIKSKGCHSIKSSSLGDQYNEIYVEIPKKLSEEERLSLEKIKKLKPDKE